MIAIHDVQYPLILTLDVGTSSVRMLCFDALARQLAGIEARRSIEVLTTPDGGAEIDVEMLFAACVAVIDEALSELGPVVQHVVAVASDTLATTMVGIDAEGQPVGPLRTYADTRSDAAATWLRHHYAEQTVHQRTGCMLRPNYWPARLHWLRQDVPHEWHRARMWMTFGEYLDWRLLGERRVTMSAAAWTGLLDCQQLTWDQEWLTALGVPETMLGRVTDVNEIHGQLLPEWQQRWPNMVHVRWLPAIGDGAAANVGSGCVNAQQLALTMGTTGAVRMVVPGRPTAPFGLWTYRVDQDFALVGGATSEGGNVYQWLTETLQLPAAGAELDAILARAEPDGHGLTVLPLWAGERSPGWAGDARATLHGMHLGTSAVDVLRAAMEGVALRFAAIVADLPYVSEQKIIASGGALLHSPAWLQIFADVLNRSVSVSAVPEATARGCAILALRSLGYIQALDDIATPVGDVYHPNPVAHQRYVAAVHRQRVLYARLIGAPLIDA